MKILNENQKRARDIVEWHLTETLEGKEPEQLLIQIQGRPETRKTEVIIAIIEVFESKGKGKALVTSAHTMAAAAFIGGQTLSHLVPLGVVEPETDMPPEGILDDIGAFWRDVSYLIINETGVIARYSLGELENTLSLAKKISGREMAERPFGGLNVILVGDFHQYPPATNGRTPLWRTINRMVDSNEEICGRKIYEMFERLCYLKTLTGVALELYGTERGLYSN